MSGVGGLFILGREAVAWFSGLAIPSKLTVVTIAFATASVGVAVVAPDVLPISPFTSSHGASVIPSPATSGKTAAPVNPSIVASAAPSNGRSTTPTTRPTQPASTVPGAGQTKPTDNASSNATKAATKKPTATGSASASGTSVYYKDCEAAWEAGAAPIPSNKPGYRVELDPDRNGVACEKRS